MKLRKLIKEDYNQLIIHAKNICNYYDLYINYNDKLNTEIGIYLLDSLLKETNYGIVLEYKNQIIGVLLAKIVDSKFSNIFDESELTNIDLENIITDDYNQNTIKQIRIQTSKVHSEMLEKYSELVNNKSELLMFAILPEHQGRGLSELLLERFKFDLHENHLNDFFLYTSSLCKYTYYEHKQYQCVKEVIFDKNNSNNEIERIINLPMYGMIFYAKVD